MKDADVSSDKDSGLLGLCCLFVRRGLDALGAVVLFATAESLCVPLEVRLDDRALVLRAAVEVVHVAEVGAEVKVACDLAL